MTSYYLILITLDIVSGVRMLDGPVTDLLEAQSLSFNNQHIDIYRLNS